MIPLIKPTKKQVLLSLGFLLEMTLFIDSGWFLAYKIYWLYLLIGALGIGMAIIVGRGLQKDAVERYKRSIGR